MYRVKATYFDFSTNSDKKTFKKVPPHSAFKLFLRNVQYGVRKWFTNHRWQLVVKRFSLILNRIKLENACKDKTGQMVNNRFI